jgi:NAD(P)-dependent dehydrogenase (short-subunit alcohol dehydrogenase family)
MLTFLLLHQERTMADLPLAGRVTLITAGAKRIGRSIALKLAAEGADVALHYRSSKAEAEATAREIRQLGCRCELFHGDVTQRKDVQALFTALEGAFGRLDVLVNNAGDFFAADFLDLTEEQWDRLLNANLKSQFLCAQAAAPLLRRQPRGDIINISSIGGVLAWPQFMHYCVSKAGSIMLTRCLAKALGPQIRVNSVAPGTIQFPGEAPDEDYIRRAPLRKVGRGEDIAEAVAFLVKSDFITGQVLVVDGGRTLV